MMVVCVSILFSFVNCRIQKSREEERLINDVLLVSHLVLRYSEGSMLEPGVVLRSTRNREVFAVSTAHEFSVQGNRGFAADNGGRIRSRAIE